MTSSLISIIQIPCKYNSHAAHPFLLDGSHSPYPSVEHDTGDPTESRHLNHNQFQTEPPGLVQECGEGQLWNLLGKGVSVGGGRRILPKLVPQVDYMHTVIRVCDYPEQLSYLLGAKRSDKPITTGN